MNQRPRYLLDTEALIRAFRSDGAPRELVERAMIRDLSLLTSTTILDELDEVLSRPKFGISGRDRAEVRRVVLAAADEVAVFDESEAPRRVADPGDDHVFESALRTDADVVVSSDQALIEMSGAPFRVLASGDACTAWRNGAPYGSSHLLSPADLQQQRERLDPGKSQGHRRGADRVLRERTNSLAFERIGEQVRATLLTPAETAELAADLVGECGARVALDLRDRGSFDYLSGARFDEPEADGPVALDLIWYSSERAQAQAIARPEFPTRADLGFPDEHQHRTVVAGGIVVVLDVGGPDGEPDVRFLAPIGEPLAPTLPISNDYRVSRIDQAEIVITELDPAGFSRSTAVWLPGGPTASLTATNLPPDGVTKCFLLADRAAEHFGLPIPPSALLESRLPARLHDLIVR